MDDRIICGFMLMIALALEQWSLSQTVAFLFYRTYFLTV